MHRLHCQPSEKAKHASQPVVALGNFDGLHLGHQAILRETILRARERSTDAVLMSFAPHPRRFFVPDTPPMRLMPLREQYRMAGILGIDQLWIRRFNAALAQMEATDFVRRILFEECRVSHLVTGEDFRFGKGRGGDAALLQQLCDAAGVGYSAIPPVMVEGAACSSSRIREALIAGDIPLAERLLGHPYTITGKVMQGDKRGRELGFPTANLHWHTRWLRPAFGVYACWMRWQGISYPAVANLGVRPHFPSAQPLLEVHLLNASPSLYGERIAVELVGKIRSEQRFASLEAMRAQLTQDCQTATAMLTADEEDCHAATCCC